MTAKRLMTLKQEAEVAKLISEVKPVDKAYLYVGISDESPENLSDEQNKLIGEALWKFAKIGLLVANRAMR